MSDQGNKSTTTAVPSFTFALIVARDEQDHIGYVVQKTQKYLPALVIDDASLDGTATEAQKEGSPVLIRPTSQGKGDALAAGLAILRSWGMNTVVCLDGDGQHEPSFLPSFVAKSQKGFHILIGNRLHNKRYMPLTRVISNSLTSLVISFYTGQLVRDSQCGYRVLTGPALKLLPQDSGFMYESEQLFLAAREGMRIGYMDISTIYRPHAVMRFHVIKDVTTFLKIFWKELLLRWA